MQNYNLHTHSIYSDGKSTPREIVEEAVRQGFETIGFSEHGPLNFETNFAVKSERMADYVAEIHQLKTEFQDKIQVLCGLELDYITDSTEPFAQTKDNNKLDYLIGGLHLVGHANNADELWFTDGPDYHTYDQGLEKFFGNDIKKAVRRFFDQTNEMIEGETFNIIAHFDKVKMHNRDRFFHEDEPWYRTMVLETLDLIKQKDLIMEVNTRGLYKKRCDTFFPSPWILEIASKMDIPAIISADAHHYSEISKCFDEAVSALKNAGYKAIAQYQAGTWTEKEL
jgi:histidinol phosphate phosphatase HisJ family